MKNKFILFSLAMIGICSISCRQSDDSFEEDLKATKENAEPQLMARDSASTGMIPGDPPRNTTHWRTASKEKENPDKGNPTLMRTDSTKTLTQVFEGDPPRNTTHWRKK
ncbi:hypothetical protein [Chryseobacterium sp. RR2-3-20]|uniref:hypothetical protein n=1 Tax=Chryseobacterium sp. RR2-3-20 TaxID=2787626 RepID=UPI001AE01323|nr:hypothetical protein [Chryseobacterium sp. RR2-3-20]